MVHDLNHNCGYCVAYSLHDAYKMVKNLNHRGRDAVGIACVGNDRIDIIKWVGDATRFDLEDLQDLFPADKYFIYLGHVRYATKGRKDMILMDAHPHVIGGTREVHDGFVIIRDCDAAIVHNGQVEKEYLNGLDTGCLETGCDSEAVLHMYARIHEPELVRRIPGAFSMAIASRDSKYVMVMRDAFGNRPGVLGRKDGKFIVASEDHAIKAIGGEFRKNLVPGAVYYMTPEGGFKEKIMIDIPFRSHCFFEWNYLLNHESMADDISADLLRRRLGARCAAEFPFKRSNAVVTYLPRCPKPAAQAYAQALGLPMVPAFFKMRSERSFLGATQEERKDSIKHNLYLNRTNAHLLKGKFLIILEDSTVRGTNSRYTAELAKEAGVEHVVLINYTDMIGGYDSSGEPCGCTSGVDMPPTDEFIARDVVNKRTRTVEEISDLVGMEMVYLGQDAMFDEYSKLGMLPEHLCTRCINGPPPFEQFERL